MSKDDENNTILGFVLLYHGLPYPVVMLRSENREALTLLLEQIPQNQKMMLFTSKSSLDLINKRYDVGHMAKEDLMVFDQAKAGCLPIGKARRLTINDAKKLSVLRATESKDAPPESYDRWIRDHTVYEIDSDETRSLYSIGGTWIESNEGSGCSAVSIHLQR